MNSTLGKSGLSAIDIQIDVARLAETRMLVTATSGAGKSWALRRILEQTHGAIQHIVIDPEDEFHTLREKYDYVLAGRHGGDCPADVRSAELLARKLLELNVSAVVGIYELPAHDRIRFVRLFLEALVNAPRELWHPALIVLDEAHLFAPQVGDAESAKAVIDLMSRGRKRGFAGLLATQRLSKLHKDAAAEAGNVMAGRFSLDVDVKRASEFLGFTGREDQARIRGLKDGEFFVYGPALTREVTLVKVGGVGTTHPKAGERAAAPPPPRATVAKVLGQLKDLPEEADRKARTEEELRAELRRVEKDLAEASRKLREVRPDPDALLRANEEGYDRARQVLAGRISALLQQHTQIALAEIENWKPNPKIPVQQIPRAEVGKVGQPLAGERNSRSELTQSAMGNPGARRRTEKKLQVAVNLPAGERATLIALAQYPDGCERDQLSILTGYKRSTRDAYVQRLRERGYATIGGVRVFATNEGITALGPDYEPLPTGEDLREYWLNRLPEGEASVLRVLIDSGGKPVDREVIDGKTNFKRSTRDAYLQRLSARRLVTPDGRGQVRASEVLFES